MPERVVLESVLVLRDGRRVRPPIGKKFNFTADELAELEGTEKNPGIRPQAFRKATSDDDAASPAEIAGAGGPSDKTADTQAEANAATGASAGDKTAPAKTATPATPAKPAKSSDSGL